MLVKPAEIESSNHHLSFNVSNCGTVRVGKHCKRVCRNLWLGDTVIISVESKVSRHSYNISQNI